MSKSRKSAVAVILVCNGCGKGLKRGETMVCKGCSKKLESGVEKATHGRCKRCDRKIRLYDATFGAGGIWCSDRCAELYLFERGML